MRMRIECREEERTLFVRFKERTGGAVLIEGVEDFMKARVAPFR